MFLKKKVRQKEENLKTVQTIFEKFNEVNENEKISPPQVKEDNEEDEQEEEITFKSDQIKSLENQHIKQSIQSKNQKCLQQIYNDSENSLDDTDNEPEITFQSNIEKVANRIDEFEIQQKGDPRKELKLIQKEVFEKTKQKLEFSETKIQINPIYFQKNFKDYGDHSIDITKLTYIEQVEKEKEDILPEIVNKKYIDMNSNLQNLEEQLIQNNENSIEMDSKKEQVEQIEKIEKQLNAELLREEKYYQESKHSEQGLQSNEQTIIQKEKNKHSPYAQPLMNIIIEDLKSFLIDPAPKGGMIQCLIIRDKSGLNKFHPKYKLMMSTNQKILMKATKLEFTMYSNENMSKLKEKNGIFTLFDDGKSPSSNIGLFDKIRLEIGAVIYDLTIDNTKKPRELKVLLPNLDENGKRILSVKSLPEISVLAQMYQNKLCDDMSVFTNRKPKWDDRTRGFVLNFFGRVKLASVKNFQLISMNDTKEIIYFQFGKVDSKRFNLDFQYPLSPLQAFMIAMTSFEFTKKK